MSSEVVNKIRNTSIDTNVYSDADVSQMNILMIEQRPISKFP